MHLIGSCKPQCHVLALCGGGEVTEGCQKSAWADMDTILLKGLTVSERSKCTTTIFKSSISGEYSDVVLQSV